MKKILILIFGITVFANGIMAQVKFTASISRSTLSKDETAQLTFQVDNAQQVENLKAPDLKDFTIVSGPNQQSSMQIINGIVKQSQSIIYLIKPNSTGTFTIGEATAKVNGELIKSNKLSLKVTEESSPDIKTPEKNKKDYKNSNGNTSPGDNFTFLSPVIIKLFLG